ncbi:MAG: GNAT family N-acetyltransferase [Actinomycetota bacterium]
MAVEIRPVRPAEHREAGRVTASAYEVFAPGGASPNADYLARVADVAARADHALVLGAFEDGRALGTVTLELRGRIPGGHPRAPLEEDQANVRMLGVDPGVQRRGIGRRLMEASIEAARRAGKRRVTLETTEAMEAAQRLYESMGFARGPDQVYDDGFRLRTYELAL